MSLSRLPVGARACALLAAACFLFLAPAAVRGADTVVAVPAEQWAIAPGGVDMRTGQYAYRQTDLTIGGTQENDGLALTRINPVPGAPNAFGNFDHNWDILLTEKRIALATENYDNFSGSDYQISVRFGGRSTSFVSYGNMIDFTEQSNAGYATLTNSGDPAGGTVVYTFRAGDGTIAVFRPLGNLDCFVTATKRCAYVSEITYPDGTKLTFAYNYNAGASSNRATLRSITSSRGYALLLERNASGISKACLLNLTRTTLPANNLCPANAESTATYAYTSFNGTRLASVTDPAGGVSSFAYAGTASSFTMAFKRPGEASPWLTNSLFMTNDVEHMAHEAVSEQNFADNSSYTYFYDHVPVSGLGSALVIAGGNYQDAAGHVATVRYDFPPKPGTALGSPCTQLPCSPNTIQSVVYQVTPGPVEVTDVLGRTTTADYCDPNLAAIPVTQGGGCLITPLQSYTDAEGRVIELQRDGARNVVVETRHALAGSGLADLVRSAIYNSRAEPVYTIDANGNRTDFTYAPEHAGPLTETGPAVNGIRPQTRYAYVQRYAWISNGAGGYVQAATPVWLPLSTSLCRTSAATGNPAAPCATANDEVRTTFDYGPNSGPTNLLPRGQVVTSWDNGFSTTLRTCWGYDSDGRRISETQPGANAATCP